MPGHLRRFFKMKALLNFILVQHAAIFFTWRWSRALSMYIGSMENAIQHYLGLGRDIPRVHYNTARSPPSVETSASSESIHKIWKPSTALLFVVACGPQSGPCPGKPAGR